MKVMGDKNILGLCPCQRPHIGYIHIPDMGPNGFASFYRDPGVSMNAIGAYEGTANTIFSRTSEQARWNSYNLGEFLFPESFLSLVPLALVLLLGIAVLVRMQLKMDREERGAS